MLEAEFCANTMLSCFTQSDDGLCFLKHNSINNWKTFHDITLYMGQTGYPLASRDHNMLWGWQEHRNPYKIKWIDGALGQAHS